MKLPRLKISFGELKMNKVVRFFILSDYLFWGGWGLINPIFAVFILQRIGSANVFTVGAAAALYYLTKAVSEVPISFYLDKHEGEKDDFHALISGLFLGGLVVLIFLAVRSVAALLAAMVVQGFAFALYSSSWPAIFSRHLDKDHYSLEWTLDHFGIDIVSSVMAFVGGGIALFLGFDFIFILGAIAAFAGAALLFIVPDLVLPKETMKEPILRDHAGPTIGK